MLQQRIHNMASVRESSNKHLTGQLSQLKEKLAASRRQQQESAAQVRMLAGRMHFDGSFHAQLGVDVRDRAAVPITCLPASHVAGLGCCCYCLLHGNGRFAVPHRQHV